MHSYPYTEAILFWLMFFIVILLRGTMSTFTKFITITSTALLMAAPLYASHRDDLDRENAAGVQATTQLPMTIDGDIDPENAAGVQATPQLQITLYGIVKVIKKQILILASQYTNPDVLRCVCKEWREIIDEDTPSNSQDGPHSYASIGPCWKEWMKASWSVTLENEAICQTFLNGKLVYRPNPDSDEGMIKLSISDFANPLKGTFGFTARSLRITTDLSVFFAVENENPKVNILIAPRFLINKYISTTATQFAQILEHWDKDMAPVGIFWRWSGDEDLSRFDYLTSGTLDDIASNNLYENWRAGRAAGWGEDCPPVAVSARLAFAGAPRGFFESFHVCFLN